jgi:hypothetical protein
VFEIMESKHVRQLQEQGLMDRSFMAAAVSAGPAQAAVIQWSDAD